MNRPTRVPLRQIATVQSVDAAYTQFYKAERRIRSTGEHDRLVTRCTQELEQAKGEPVMLASRHDSCTGRVLYVQQCADGIAVLTYADRE